MIAKVKNRWSHIYIPAPAVMVCRVTTSLNFRIVSAAGTNFGALAELRKATIGILVSACPSVRPHGIAWLPLDEFSLNVISEYFSKTCIENSSFINPLTPELNPSAQRCLPRFFTGDFNF
jgi:hypothetical protein